MKRRLSHRGHTLVELTLAILLMAIVLPPLLNWFSKMVVTAAQADVLPTAVGLGSELMEEIKSRKFDELDSKVSGDWSTTLGVDSGEVGSNKQTFDDVDDFNGWSQNFGGSFSNYSANVVVQYVAGSNLNNPLSFPPTTSYKRIVVTIPIATLPAANIRLTSIVTEVQSL